MRISFEGNKLTLDGKEIVFEARIRKVNEHERMFLVRLSDEDLDKDDPNAERNIVAVGFDGEIMWRIQRAPSAPTFKGKRAFNPYVGIDAHPARDDGFLEAVESTMSRICKC